MLLSNQETLQRHIEYLEKQLETTEEVSHFFSLSLLSLMPILNTLDIDFGCRIFFHATTLWFLFFMLFSLNLSGTRIFHGQRD